jgi:hypothetical protein
VIRPIVLRIVVVGVGLCAGLAVAELALRLTGAAPTDGLVTVSEKEFNTIPGILAPRQSLVDRRNPRLPYVVTTNSLGYRGGEFPEAKAPGEKRILFVGDSFTFGDFVNDDQTLPAQLEQRLRRYCPAVRVVNSGLGDATIVDEAMMMQRGLRLRPDLVIALFSENDVTDLDRESTWDRLAANRRAKSEFPLGLVYPALRRLALWNFALSVRATWRAKAQDSPATGARRAAAPEHADSLTRSLRSSYVRTLMTLRDSLARMGVPLAFAAYPSHFSLSRDAANNQIQWITGTAADSNVFAVNLTPPLRQAGLPAESLYLLPHDGHPSARGYAVAASYLADMLTSAGPLRKSCR